MNSPFVHHLIGLAIVLLLPISSPQAADHPHGQRWEPWQVIEVKSGRVIAFDDWIVRLLDQEVIYLGEEHRNQWHIEAAQKVLEALLKQDRHAALALEMFAWDGQEALNHYLSDPAMSHDRFLQESRWEQNWGGGFDDYAPLILFARDLRLPVLALNPPRPLVRQVASQGLARAFGNGDMGRWGMQKDALIDEPAYRDIILAQLRHCHAGLSEEAYDRMYEASLFRDEGMAHTIANYLMRKGADHGGRSAGPLLSYTGGGHIQYGLPVPNRVLRRRNGQVKQTTVYLRSFPAEGGAEQVTHLLGEAIADYLWLTPVSAHGAPQQCQ